jgi:hypothetical protein
VVAELHDLFRRQIAQSNANLTTTVFPPPVDPDLDAIARVSCEQSSPRARLEQTNDRAIVAANADGTLIAGCMISFVT